MFNTKWRCDMSRSIKAGRDVSAKLFAALLAGVALSAPACAEESRGKTSYAPVDIKEDFAKTMTRMKAEKPKVMVMKRSTMPPIQVSSRGGR